MLSKFDSSPTQVAKWIILDIDETLVRTRKNLSKNGRNNNLFLPLTYKSMDGFDDVTSWTQKRPGLDVFLNYCLQNFNVGIWSAGQPNYVNTVVQNLFQDFEIQPQFIYNWMDCMKEKGHVRKPLAWTKCPLDITLLIENNDENVSVQDVDNVVIVPSFRGSMYDTVLIEIMNWLPSFKESINVRTLLKPTLITFSHRSSRKVSSIESDWVFHPTQLMKPSDFFTHDRII